MAVQASVKMVGFEIPEDKFVCPASELFDFMAEALVKFWEEQTG